MSAMQGEIDMETAEDTRSERMSQSEDSSMTDIMHFFKVFSERAYKENNLSDVTYALCEACVEFRQYFLDFFFSDFCLDARHVEFEREHSDNSRQRPDFWIKTEKGVFIVEVKIRNRNHHFSDYFKLLSGEEKLSTDSTVWKRLGYIANYNSIKDVLIDGVRARDMCRVATWKEFIEGIKITNPLTQAYIEYVKGVCPFDDFKLNENWLIEVDDFKAIKNFGEDLKMAIGCAGCNVYRSYGSFRRFRSQQKMGECFEWKVGGNGELSGKTARGWLGVRYLKKGAVVCVEFEDRQDWGKEICVCCKKQGTLTFWSKNSVQVVADADSLGKFLTSVFAAIENHTFNDATSKFCFDVEKVPEDTLSKPLFAMRCLPFAIENNLFADGNSFADTGYEFVFVNGNDDEVPESHCGRYFELRKQGKNSEPSIGAENNAEWQLPVYRGWIGVNYNESCKRLLKSSGCDKEGRSFGERPAFIIEVAKDFPDTTGLNENSWGWKYCEIEKGRNLTIKTVRDKFLDLCGIEHSCAV